MGSVSAAEAVPSPFELTARTLRVYLTPLERFVPVLDESLVMVAVRVLRSELATSAQFVPSLVLYCHLSTQMELSWLQARVIWALPPFAVKPVGRGGDGGEGAGGVGGGEAPADVVFAPEAGRCIGCCW